MQLPHKPPFRAGSLDRSAKARMEAEALFRPAAPEPEASKTVVILKKRRALPGSGPGEQAAQAEGLEAPSEQQEQVRAPRVHRVSLNERSAEPADTAADAAQPASDVPASEAASQPAPARKRRRLHGRVSILRPMEAESAEEIAAEPVALVSQSAEEAAATANGFVFEHVPSKKHVELLARIAELQAEAETLRRQEMAHAIEWMRAAIRDYGLTRQDLGFR